MKRRVLTLPLLISCCFLLLLCNTKNSQAETYYSNGYGNTYSDADGRGWICDENYDIRIYLSKKSEYYGATFREAYVPGKELIIPDSVEYKGKIYPVNRFLPLDEDHGKLMPYQTVVLPDSVKEVKLNCNWANVTKINIPKSMKSFILERPVMKQRGGPSKLKFVVPDVMDHYIFKNNALYSKKKPGKLVYPLNIPAKYHIAEGTTTLEARCFASTNAWRYVKEITCPASLVELKGSVFGDCSKLETVDMTKTKIKILSYAAFDRTPNLKKVLLPKTLRKIEYNVFYKSGISQLTIPSKVSVIGDRAFRRCEKLKKITFEGTKKIPAFVSTEVFTYTRSGIKFYVKNRKMAKQLKKRLKKSGVKKAKIYAGKKKKLIYKNVNG